METCSCPGPDAWGAEKRGSCWTLDRRNCFQDTQRPMYHEACVYAMPCYCSSHALFFHHMEVVEVGTNGAIFGVVPSCIQRTNTLHKVVREFTLWTCEPTYLMMCRVQNHQAHTKTPANPRAYPQPGSMCVTKKGQTTSNNPT